MSLKRREFLQAGGLVLALESSSVNPQRDPIDSLHNMVDDLDPLPHSEYAGRIEKARRLLATHQMDALFVEGGSSLLYFTGVQWGRSERTFGAVIPRRGKPGFVCPAFEQGRAEERLGAVDSELRVWQEHESPFRVIAETLSDRGLRTGRLALEPSTRHFIRAGISREAPSLHLEDGQPISDGCRMTKNARELRYMVRANEITKKAYRAALQGLTDGMTPSELNRRIGEAHSRMGTRGGALVLFGPAAAFPHGTRDPQKLKEGDVVLLDGGCSVHGYRSDVTRTTVFGRPTDKQRQVWEIVRKAQEAALQLARPGVTCEELDRTARRVIEEAGYGPGYRYFTHRLGHGIGLDGHEAPYLVQGNELPLQPGMTFSNEPGIYLPGEFGIRHEDVMMVTETGAEFMGVKTRSITDAV